MPDMSIREIASEEDLTACLAIRRRVFIDEQGVSEADELDGLDGACRHFLARSGGVAMGTARLKSSDDGLKVQRVAVLPESRGTGLGAALMRHLMDVAAEANAPLVLGAQLSAVGFYEKLGFVVEGDEYMDAGIPHRDMRWTPG